MKQTKLFKIVDERYQIEPLVDYMAKKEVPIHRAYVWYYFGGVTLFLFIVQIITGILLLFYYQPGTDTAYESIQFIMSKVEYGWLIRSLHSWAANLMVLTAFIHGFSVLFTKAYRKPRELTWVTGAFLLLLSMIAGFSGYLLPWNKLSYFAVQIGTKMMDTIPFVGDYFLQVLRGGEDVTGATLHRFFGFHITIIPIIFIMIVFFHLLFVQRQGMSEPFKPFSKQPEKDRKAMKFFPNFVLRDIVVWLIVLNILVILAVFFPWELGEKADPLASAPKNLKPEWFFLAMYVVLEIVPKEVGVVLFTIIGILWFLIPFLDRKTSRGESSNVVIILGIIFGILLIILTLMGHFYDSEFFSKLH